MATNKNQTAGLTTKELTQIWTRWWWMNELPRTYERQIAPSLMYALAPLLKKMYQEPEELKAAYYRHLTFYNTDAVWGEGRLQVLSPPWKNNVGNKSKKQEVNKPSQRT